MPSTIASLLLLCPVTVSIEECPPAGSYVQATYLAGTLYAQAMERHHETGTTCHGSDCFQTVFLINAVLALGSVVTSTLLWRRTKHIYAKVIEVTKAERAKRGLRVTLTVLSLTWPCPWLCVLAVILARVCRSRRDAHACRHLWVAHLFCCCRACCYQAHRNLHTQIDMGTRMHNLETLL